MSSIRTETVEDVLVVYPTDSALLDDTRIQQFGNDLIAAVDTATGGKLLVICQTFQHASNTLLGKMVQLNKLCKSREVNLKFCCVPPKNRRSLKIHPSRHGVRYPPHQREGPQGIR